MPLSCALDTLNLPPPAGADFRPEPEPQLGSWITFDPDDWVDLDQDADEF